MGCGLGQEYEYDTDNRLVRIRRDTDDRPGRNLTGTLPELNTLMKFVYDALGRRIETIDYVDGATGRLITGAGGNPSPRRTRHVYFSLELIQEYSCGADGGTPAIPGACSCGTSQLLVREFVWGDSNRYPEPVAFIRHNPDTQDS